MTTISKVKGLWTVRDGPIEWKFETFKEAEEKKQEISSRKLKEMSQK